MVWIMRKRKLKWTYERCKEEALKYNNRSEFRKGRKGAYERTRKEGWLDELCSHMENKPKKLLYWTKERCQEEALKYKHRIEFIKGSSSAYGRARIEGWLDDICSHMTSKASLKNRYIYSYEFPEYNCVYIGLTWNIKQRQEGHSKRGTVYKFMKENNLSEKDYVFSVFGKYDMTIAGKKEKEKEKEYLQNGWEKLNKAKTGGLGGGIKKWTKEKCQIEALKYKHRDEFFRCSRGAYTRARIEGWLDVVCSHMEKKHKWTKENCQIEALKYNTRSKFSIGSGSAYKKAMYDGWLDEICSHMKPNIYWTKEKCQEEALNYKHRNGFKKGSGSAYYRARVEGWLDEICSHMKRKHKWTKENCQIEALKYKNRTDFSIGSSGSYNKACNDGLLDKICSHMKRKYK